MSGTVIAEYHVGASCNSEALIAHHPGNADQGLHSRSAKSSIFG